MQPHISFVKINRNIDALFACLTDRAQAGKLFEHVQRIEDVQHADTRRYRQSRLLHGIAWTEMVDVLVCKPPVRYELRIGMFGVETRYTYTLEAIDAEQTWLHLRQSAHGKGLGKILHPLIRHVFSRPEHDGNHVQHLKRLFEQDLPGQPVP